MAKRGPVRIWILVKNPRVDAMIEARATADKGQKADR